MPEKLPLPELDFTSDFTTSNQDKWRQAAEQLLKGKPFDQTLLTPTYEEITLKPIYTPDDFDGKVCGSNPGIKGHWEICQELAYTEPAEFNSALVEALQQGQTAVNLTLDSAGRHGMDDAQLTTVTGTAISTLEDLQTALESVDLFETPLFIEPGLTGTAVAAFLVELCRLRGLDCKNLAGCIASDPLSELARTGSIDGSESDQNRQLAQLTLWAKNHMPAMRTIGVDANPYHNAGANAVQELAYAMATGAAYVRGVLNEDTNLSVFDITSRMRFSFAVGSNFFMEIAKLRAARLLWREIIKIFGGNEAAQQMFLHARSSHWNKTILDRHVNILRAGTEALSALAGGCDSLHVAPFDSVIQPAGTLSQRLARNIQLILKAESHLERVADPAAGSWYVETLTREICEKAWAFFQEIEAKGGMLAALTAGLPQREIANTAAERAENIKSKKDRFVGANAFPNPKEAPAEKHENSCLPVYENRIMNLARYKRERETAAVSAALEHIRNVQNDRQEEIMPVVLAAVKAGATLEEICGALLVNSDSELEAEALTQHRGLEAFENSLIQKSGGAA